MNTFSKLPKSLLTLCLFFVLAAQAMAQTAASAVNATKVDTKVEKMNASGKSVTQLQTEKKPTDRAIPPAENKQIEKPNSGNSTRSSSTSKVTPVNVGK